MNALPELTKPERLLITSIATAVTRNRERGITRSVKTKEVARAAHRSHGWVAATANKRLFERRWRDLPKDGGPGYVDGLGLVHICGNGYVWLTEKGKAAAALIEAGL